MTAIARLTQWPTADHDVARAGQPGVIDVSRPPSREAFWKPFLAWLEAAALVPLAVATLIAAGIPLVLAVRSVVNALSWVIGRVW